MVVGDDNNDSLESDRSTGFLSSGFRDMLPQLSNGTQRQKRTIEEE